MAIKVKMHYPEDGEVTRTYKQSINRIEPLGREIKISPKSAATVNEAGHELKFLVPTVSVLIGIGKDETADLVMTEDAWNALNNGEKLNISTVKEFKKLIGIK